LFIVLTRWNDVTTIDELSVHIERDDVRLLKDKFEVFVWEEDDEYMLKTLYRLWHSERTQEG
jgi:hypothetical protein